MKSTLLTAIITLASVVAFAGDPTPPEETDLPASFTSALNGTKLQEGLSDLVETAADDMILSFLSSEEKICKKCFLYAAAKLLEIVDDKALTDLFKELGYTIWTGSGDDREIYIRGFFNKDTALKPNDVIDKLYEIFCPRIDYMITQKTTYSNKYSLEVCANDEDWDESFDIDYKIAGIEVFETDYSVDRGDAYAIIGALRAVEAVLCYLKGVDLSGDAKIPDLIARIAALIDGEADLETIVAELSDFLRTTKPRTGGQDMLNDACTYLKSALKNIQLADQWILKTRTDRAQHIIGKDAEEIGHMIAYDVNNPIIALAREYCTTVSSMLSGPVSLSRDQLVDILYTAGLFEKKVAPPWLAKTNYILSLAPLFNASINWVEKLPQVDGDYVCIDTLPDPTIGGIFVGFKKQDAITLLEELTVKEQFTYEGYVEYNVNMPYRDGTVGEDHLQHAQPRRIVMTVEGEGTLEYYSTLENANGDSALQLYVDGEKIKNRSGSGGRKTHHGYWIAGSGTHTLVWEYTGPTDEVGKYLREATAGVRPLGDVIWTNEPKPVVPQSWSLATKEEVWAVLDGFGESGKELKDVVTTPAEYGDLRNWLGWAKDATHEDMNAVAQDPRMAISYELVLAGIVQGGSGAAHVFANEPKIEIADLTIGAGLQIEVRVTDGETLVKAAKTIEEKVQVCTDLGEGSWQKVTAAATVNANGTATVTVVPPNGDSCFLRVKAE